MVQRVSKFWREKEIRENGKKRSDIGLPSKVILFILKLV